MIKKVIILTIFTAFRVLAFGDTGEYYTIAAGSAIGIGYKEMVQSLPSGTAIPAVTTTFLVELCLSLLITNRVIVWNNLPERQNLDKYASNIGLMYASSLVAALGLYGFEKYILREPDLQGQIKKVSKKKIN